MIMENETTDYAFNVTEIGGYSRILIYHPESADTVTIVIHKFLGDRTGQFHLRSNQKAWIEYIESLNNVTQAPVSYLIDDGSEIVFPTEVHMQGIGTTIGGKIVNVHHLYIEDGCTVTVSSTAQTATMENMRIIEETDPGNFSLPTINIKMDGILEFRKIENTYFTITAAGMEMKFKGRVNMNHGTVVVGDLDMEPESVFSMEARGHKAGEGEGAGSGNVGGSHGGVAGGATDEHAYGSVFRPLLLGSGGGGSGGGAGGGFAHFIIGKTMHIDGQVDTYGGDATGNGGGGSGGSIMIEAYNFSGHGILDASGGDGSGSGYGGSGGRIAVLIEFQNNYGGQYLAHGGLSGDRSSQSAGGPGTLYKYESRRGPTYRDLKYNPRLNVTHIEPEHTKLIVENDNLQTNNPAIVMENGSIYYEFDELQVEGYSYVHFYHPENAEIVKVLIHELTGNKKGMVRVQAHQQVIVHFVPSTHTYLDAPCGFHVDTDAELVLPTTVIILTERTNIGGGLVGVEELIIERNAEFIIDNEVKTADDFDFQAGVMQTIQLGTDSGYFNVPKLSVNNLGIFRLDLNPLSAHIIAPDFIIRKGGLVAADTKYVYLEGSDLIIEPGGLITGDGQGSQVGEGDGKGGTVTYDSGGGAFASSGKLQVWDTYTLPGTIVESVHKTYSKRGMCHHTPSNLFRL